MRSERVAESLRWYAWFSRFGITETSLEFGGLSFVSWVGESRIVAGEDV